MTTDLIKFVEGKIDQLMELRESYEEAGDTTMDDYLAGAIDAYDIIRMKLTD